jgi:uncharacterized protein
MNIEYTSFFDFELKQLEETGTFEGYASTFGNTDLQGDVVAPGAFTQTLAKSHGRVPVLMVHRTWQIVGFGTNAAEDEKGLKVKAEFTLASDAGRNAYAVAQHAHKIGHKLGLSIGYFVPEGGAEYNDRTGVRKLKQVDLYEYSIAPIPANPRARIAGVKSAGVDWTAREFEEYLRDAGFSREAAKRITAGGFKALADQRDVDQGDRREAAAFMSQLRTLSLGQTMKGL